MLNYVVVAGVGILGASAFYLNKDKPKSLSPNRCVPKSSDGWVQAINQETGQKVSLPEYLRVKVEKTEAGLDYFHPTEGVFRSQSFTMKHVNGASYLESNLPNYRNSAKLTYRHSDLTLSTPVGKFQSKMSETNPIPMGSHRLQLPDFPHRGGRGYEGQARKALCWFHIGSGIAEKDVNDRYLHTGEVSAGCITISEVGRWDELYSYLILCRDSDGIGIGTINVAP